MILKVGNRTYDFFNKINVDLKYNSFASAFSFDARFDPNNANHRRLFRPLSYQTVQLIERSEVVLTGTVISHGFSFESEPKLINVNGYARPGVLGDCSIDINNYPLEFSGLSLRQITEQLISPYNIQLSVDPLVADEVDEVIEKIDAKQIQTVAGFINQIAAQKNVVLSHDELGRLLLTRANANTPSIATYIEGIPSLKISLKVGGQKIHNNITVFKQADLENDNAGQEEINNPLLTAFRPLVKTQNIGNDITTVQAARNARASELRNIQLTIETDRWTWFDGRTVSIIKPNNIITVLSPNNYIFRRTNFFVESVKLSLDPTAQKATLNCVLPEVYNDTEPTNIFT